MAEENAESELRSARNRSHDQTVWARFCSRADIWTPRHDRPSLSTGAFLLTGITDPLETRAESTTTETRCEPAEQFDVGNAQRFSDHLDTEQRDLSRAAHRIITGS